MATSVGPPNTSFDPIKMTPGMNIEKLPTIDHDVDRYMILRIGPPHPGSG
jgi:hypothetical protein